MKMKAEWSVCRTAVRRRRCEGGSKNRGGSFVQGRARKGKEREVGEAGDGRGGEERVKREVKG